MADSSSTTAPDTVTGEVMTTVMNTTTSLMTSSGTTPLHDSSSLWTTEVVNSSIMMNMSGLLEFPGPQNATATNTSLSGNFSRGLAANDSQDVDLEALNLAKTKALIPTIVYLAVLMVVGAVGNTVAFLVYYKRFKPSATRTYILAMSVCDLLANLLSLPSEIIDIRFWYTFDLPVLCRCVRGFNSFLALTSAFVLVAVARDRFNKICRPMKKQRSLKRIKLYVLICMLASLALSLVFFVLNGSRTLPTGVGNVTGTTCSVSDQFKGTLFPMVYNGLMALSFITCVTIMIVCYIRIALELWRHKKKQERMSEKAPVGKDSSAKDSTKALTPIVEDTSSGPINRPHQSATDSSSTAELIPLKNTVKKNSDTNPSYGLDKQVVLLSFKNHNYEGPGSSVEDSDEGCFSGCSVDTTSTSADHSKGGQTQNGQEGRGDSGSFPDAWTKEEAESAQDSSTKLMGATSKGDRVVPGNDSPTETSSTSRVQQTMPMTHPDIQASDDPQTTAHRTMVDRSSSLLQRLLTPRKRHQGDDDTKKPGKACIPCRIPKKRGTVKSIPSSTTLMMFVLTATFIINYLPHLLVIILRAISKAYFAEDMGDSALNGYNIALRSYFMNCAANSLVYGFCSPRFRQECRLLFRRK
ncbi:uncharacterized protein LOC143302188 [Babylonia areolata]|uniref:uncharacterized protein LOC143302188 n=1 Tax=Babylonia areolata TaxID=304850 RepID=UPI003FD17A29